MSRTTIRPQGGRSLGSLFLALALTFAACDSADPDPITGDATLQGRVAAEGNQNVQGAQVSAWTYAAGTTAPQQAAGQATTAADGTFSLTTPATAHALIVRAQWDGDQRASALVESGGGAAGTVRVGTLNRETTAQADVYVGARTTYQGVQVHDAFAYVDAAAAAALQSGTATEANVSAALAAAAQAEAAYVRHQQGGAASDAAVTAALVARTQAAATYREALAAGSATSAEARTAFESAFTGAYAGAGLDARVGAEASLVGARAAARFGGNLDTQGGFAAARKAQVVAAASVAAAIEQEFETAGATQARREALAQARATYMASLRAATSAGQMTQAHAAYRAAVVTELAGQTGLGASAVNAAFENTATLRATLDGSVLAATNAQAVVNAYATYFTSVRSLTAAAFDLGAQGAYAARVVALLSVH